MLLFTMHSMRKLSSLVLLTGLMRLAAADKVVGGPLVVNATGRTATVVWVVESGGANLQSQDGSETHSAPTLRSESVRFTGLKAGTSYR